MLPADAPKTDRELLLQIHGDMQSIKERLEGRDGKGGLCAQVENQGVRISNLENWKYYIVGGISLATFALVVFGRYLDLGGKI